jgi:hypothetical protein
MTETANLERWISTRSQQVLLWWGIGFTAVYVVSLGFLIGVVPPPSPSWSAARVAEYYSDHQDRILLGAVLTSFTGAFMIPIAVVTALQSARREPGRPVWSIFMFTGGTFTSIFLVLPTLFFGVAAYRPDRSPEITVLMHDLAYLALFTTVQFYIFFGVPIAVSCLRGEDAADSPFPRLYGWFTIWCTFMFEIGGVAFLAKHGPFAWNGLFIFWIPFFFFFLWLTMLCVLLHRALAVQERAAAPRIEEPLVVPVGAVR